MWAAFVAFSTILGVYVYFQKQEDLTFEISISSVFSTNTELEKLVILYDSTNLYQTSKDLKILTIKVVNNGSKGIQLHNYDSRSPIGFKIDTGEIIQKPEIIRSSNKYLDTNATVIDWNSRTTTFSQAILDQDDYFVVQVLILIMKDVNPQIISYGKIAGQKEIQIITDDSNDNESLWRRAFYGNYKVQLLRGVIYLLCFLILIIIIAFIAVLIENITYKRKRIRLVNRFKDSQHYSSGDGGAIIFNRYVNGVHPNLAAIRNLTQDMTKLNELYAYLIKKPNATQFPEFDIHKKNHIIYWHSIQEMIKDGIVYVDEVGLLINRKEIDTLIKFLFFLEKAGAPVKSHVKPDILVSF